MLAWVEMGLPRTCKDGLLSRRRPRLALLRLEENSDLRCDAVLAMATTPLASGGAAVRPEAATVCMLLRILA